MTTWSKEKESLHNNLSKEREAARSQLYSEFRNFCLLTNILIENDDGSEAVELSDMALLDWLDKNRSPIQSFLDRAALFK